VRTNPKSGTEQTGSAMPRSARRRTIKSSSQKPAAVAADSEQDIRGEIARLAYLLWEARGGFGGSPEDDWLRAEQEILARSRT